VKLVVPASTLRQWDSQQKAYVVEPGDYVLEVGASSTDIRGTVRVRLGP
jgi:beta-glucosidase